MMHITFFFISQFPGFVNRKLRFRRFPAFFAAGKGNLPGRSPIDCLEKGGGKMEKKKLTLTFVNPNRPGALERTLLKILTDKLEKEAPP